MGGAGLQACINAALFFYRGPLGPRDLLLNTAGFNQITIIGTGLIGGSFALAVRRAGFTGQIIGCDREPVLMKASDFGAIDQGVTSPEEAVKGSDLIVLATPVGSIIDLLERIGPLADTDLHLIFERIIEIMRNIQKVEIVAEDDAVE